MDRLKDLKLNQKEVAELLGTSDRQLRRLIDSRDLPAWGAPIKEIVQAYIKYREALSEEENLEQQLKAAENLPPFNENDPSSLLAHKNIEDVKLTIERRKKLEYENAETRRELVLLEDVVKQWEELVLVFRQAVLNIPAKCSGILAEEAEPEKIAEILTEVVHECLEELAKERVAESD
jgi:phage terminase Nu1 subunit (DNA packaging protein)